jgi:hypothetical protein
MKRKSYYESPVDGFLFHQQDETAPDFNYYAFQNTSAEYYMLKENKVTGECLYRYVLSPTTYDADWAARATVVFVRPAVAFASLAL